MLLQMALFQFFFMGEQYSTLCVCVCACAHIKSFLPPHKNVHFREKKKTLLKYGSHIGKVGLGPRGPVRRLLQELR